MRYIGKPEAGSGTTDLTSDVTGILPVANGGTGLTGISTLLNSNVTTISGNAGTATKLATQRDLQVDLAESGAGGFDGSGNTLDIGVGSSVLGVTNGGTGLTSISTLLNSNTTKSDVGLSLVENKSSATIRGEIVSGDIPNNAADTSGNAATADALTSGNKTIAGNLFLETSSVPLLALKRSSTGSDGDGVGTIRFTGKDDADNIEVYASIVGEIVDASDGAEEGQLKIMVASHDGEDQAGLVIKSGNAEDEVDVTIGNEATSVTTIAGTLTMGSTPTLDNSGNLLTNATTATALATARNIAGVAFDGTGDISLNNNAITNGAGYTTNTGDITSIQLTSSVGSHTESSGAAEFVLAGANGLTFTNVNETFTVTAASASASTKGVVELATTGEADTGTDTARAVTPAGLKSHVDARYTYQYISFTGNATTPSDGDWMVPSGNGISNHLWNTNASNGSGGSSNGKTKGSSNITVAANQAGCGIIVPQACVLVGFDAMVRNGSRHANLGASGDATAYLKDQRSCGVFVGQPTYNDYAATGDLTLRAYSAQLGQGSPDNDFYLRITRATDMSANHALSAGDMIVPAIAGTLSDGNHHSGGCIVSWTIVLKTLIP